MSIIKYLLTISLFFVGAALLMAQDGQMGVGTRTPHGSTIAEVNSTDKGVLIPRLAIPDVLLRNPVSVAPADGLLAYKVNTPTTAVLRNKKGLVHWNTAANSGNGAWDRHLYFKETPKTAVIGFSGLNITVLGTGYSAGHGGYLGTNALSLGIASSGHLPGLSVSKRNSSEIPFPPLVNATTRHAPADNIFLGIHLISGTYLIEVSFVLNAPPSGTPLQGNYHNMGYFTDFIVMRDDGGNAFLSNVRVEDGILSQANERHVVTFLTTVVLSGSPSYTLYPYIGRRSGSSHNGAASFIPDGSYYKITKLL